MCKLKNHRFTHHSNYAMRVEKSMSTHAYSSVACWCSATREQRAAQLFDSLITILHFGFYYNRLGVEGGLREPPIPSKRLKVGRR